MKQLIWITFLVLFTTSCERIADRTELTEKGGIVYHKQDLNEPYTGKVTSTFENGLLSYEGEYLNGRKHGEFRDWYSNQSVKSTTVYIKGKKSGTAVEYASNGSKIREKHFENDGLNGLYSEWDENGILLLLAEYNNNLKDGTSKEFFPNGNVKKQSVYTKGYLHGKTSEWYESGQLKSETNFSNDTKNGKYQSWYKSGVKESECTFINGNVNGEVLEWFETGKPKLGKIQSELLLRDLSFLEKTGIIELVTNAGPYIKNKDKCEAIMEEQFELAAKGLIDHSIKESVIDYYGQEASRFTYEAITTRAMDTLIVKTLATKNDQKTFEAIIGHFELIEVVDVVQQPDSKDAEIEYSVKFVPNGLNDFARVKDEIIRGEVEMRVIRAHYFTNGWKLIKE